MEATNKEFEAVFDQVRGSRDALSVRRVFGDPYELDGVTVIPVARVIGGAGGGGGTGEGPDGKGTGSGSGTGFGLSARGIGVYEVRDGKVEWKPAIDVTSLAKGGQMLGALVVICLTLVLVRWRRDS